MRPHRLTALRTRDALADDGPIVLPGYRLEVHDPAVGPGTVEMDEPTLPRGGLHVPALMRPLDVRAPLGEHPPEVIGSLDVPRAQHCLGSLLDSAEGREDVVIPVALVELGAFEGGQVYGVVHDDLARIQHALAIGTHLMQDQRPGAHPGVNQPGAAVLVPEGTGILQARLPDHLDGRIPGAGRLRRRGHENTLGRCYEVDVQAAGVSPDGRSPDTARVAIAQRVVEPGV